MMGFVNGVPGSGVDSEDDERHVAELLWPVLCAMATAMVENEENYLFEGVELAPHHLHTLSVLWPGRVRACFVGYADVNTAAKLAQLRRHGGGTNDWLCDYDDAALIAEIERIKAQSAYLRAECARFGLPYFEAGLDRADTVAQVVAYLRSG